MSRSESSITNACRTHHDRLGILPLQVIQLTTTKAFQTPLPQIPIPKNRYKSSIQKPHLIVQNAPQPPLRPTIDRRPLLRSLAKFLGIGESLGQLHESAVHDVLLLGERFCQFDLVVVEQGFVGDDDEGDGDAQGVEDGAGACSVSVCV